MAKSVSAHSAGRPHFRAAEFRGRILPAARGPHNLAAMAMARPSADAAESGGGGSARRQGRLIRRRPIDVSAAELSGPDRGDGPRC